MTKCDSIVLCFGLCGQPADGDGLWQYSLNKQPQWPLLHLVVWGRNQSSLICVAGSQDVLIWLFIGQVRTATDKRFWRYTLSVGQVILFPYFDHWQASPINTKKWEENTIFSIALNVTIKKIQLQQQNELDHKCELTFHEKIIEWTYFYYVCQFLLVPGNECGVWQYSKSL